MVTDVPIHCTQMLDRHPHAERQNSKEESGSKKSWQVKKSIY